jgi:hypothetical protein
VQIVQEKLMTAHSLPEDNAVAKFIGKIPFAERIKEGWIKTIRADGLNEEMVETIREKLGKLPVAEGQDPNTRGRELAEYGNLIRLWRIAKNKNQFHTHR